jgi:hypothetical protein
MKKTLLILAVAGIAMASCSKKKGCTDPMSIQYNSDA